MITFHILGGCVNFYIKYIIKSHQQQPLLNSNNLIAYRYYKQRTMSSGKPKSSLAQQLQSLKIQQKDQVVLPQRTKLSFLFDIKQAANIDDQTIYYLCQGGLAEIQQEFPQLYEQLSAFQGDIFNLKSLDFYRGTQTKDALKEVNDKLEILVKILAPYFLNSSTHKVLEYLIRIFEINAYAKHALAFACLPYYETSFFLKMLQIINIEKDEYFYFMQEYAYKGQALDKPTLIKGLGRNDGQLFAKYALYCFELAQLHSSTSQTNVNSLHWKFYGMALVEILRIQPGNQVLLFNILPLIAQGLKSFLKEIKIASLLAISQICSRKSLSQEYALAFIQEIILAAHHAENDESFIEQAVIVLLIIFQYQNIQQVPEKDLKQLLKLPKIQKVLTKLSKTHDFSHFYKSLIVSCLESTNNKTDDITIIKPVILSTANLKSLFIIIEATLHIIINESDKQPKGLEILNIIKDFNPSWYNQSLIHVIKQAPNQQHKDAILEVLQKGSSHQNLVAKFGEMEYSLLSALGSQQKQTKINALKAINAPQFKIKLVEQETDLIKLQLITLLSRNTEDDETVEAILDALQGLTQKSKNNSSEFDCLEQFISQNYENQKYSQELIQRAIQQASILHVTDNERQVQQLLLQIFTGHIGNVPENFNSLFYKQKGKIDSKIFAQQTLANSHQAIILFENIFKNQRGYFNNEIIANIFSQISHNFKSNLDVHAKDIVSFWASVLKSLAQFQNEKIYSLLEFIILGLPLASKHSTLESQIEKCVSKIIQIALNNRINNQNFSLANLHSLLLKNQFNSSVDQSISFYLKLSISSKNAQLVVFLEIMLAQALKHSSVNFSTFLSHFLVLLNNDSKLVREYSFKIADIYFEKLNQGQNLEHQKGSTKKSSVRKDEISKSQGDDPIFTLQEMQTFYKEISKVRTEIVQDRKQLQGAFGQPKIRQALNNLPQVLPIFQVSKTKLKVIQILNLQLSFITKQTMSLPADLVSKELDILRQKIQFDKYDNSQLAAFGSYLSNYCLHTEANSHSQQLSASTILLPYIQFVLSLIEKKVKLTQEVEEVVALIFNSNIFNKEFLASLNEQSLNEVILSYLKAQQFLFSKLLRTQIKDSLTKVSSGLLQASQFQAILASNIQEVNINQEGAFNRLEIVLETLLQVGLNQQEVLIPTLINLTKALSTQSSKPQVSYLIEISVQFCVQAIENYQKPKNGSETVLLDYTQLLNEIVESQLKNLATSLQEQLNDESSQKVDDPFKEFIMDVDEDNKNVNKKDTSSLTNTAFQILNSLFTLLYIMEAKTGLNTIQYTMSALDSLALLVKQCTTKAEGQAQSATSALLLHETLRYFSAQVNKAAYQFKDQHQSLRKIAAKFIDSLLDIQQFMNIDELESYINKLLEKNQQIEIQQLVLLLLLNSSKDSVQVSDDMQLDSTEIKLIYRVIIHKNNLNGLQSIQDLLFLLAVIPLLANEESQLQQKLTILFEEAEIFQIQEKATWFKERYANDDKAMRKLKYVSLYLINDIFVKDTVFDRQLSKMTHSKNTETKDKVFDLLYRIYIYSHLLKDSVSAGLQTKQFKDNKEKKSLKRLNKRVQVFQNTLNQMLSYDVQVSITLKVLNYGHKSVTSLKTNTLQLLINKLPNFATELSFEKQKEMVLVFDLLIKRAAEMLKQIITEAKLKKSTDYQQLVQALFGIVGRTACAPLEQKLKDKTIQMTLSYLSQASHYSLTLHSTLLITAVNIFEVYQTQILEELPSYFDMVMNVGFTRMFQASEQKNFFVTSYSQSVLKATLSLCVFFAKFLNASQFETMIKNILIVGQENEDEVKAILDVISKEVINNSGLKLVFLAVFNSYESVLIQQGIEAKALPNISMVAQRFFGQLLTPILKRMKKEFVQENYKKIFQFFKQAFGLGEQYFRSNEKKSDMENLDAVESTIVESFEQFTIKLSEEMLRPLIIKVVKWSYAKKHLNLELTNGPSIHLHRATFMLKLFNGLLNTLRDFFVPLLTLYFDKLVELLTSLGSQYKAPAKDDKKRLRSEINIDINATEGQTLFKLLQLVVENTRLNFALDTHSFIQLDQFEQLIQPVSDLLTCLAIGGGSSESSKYREFVELSVKELVLEMVEKINNDEMWKKLNYQILLNTRSQHTQVRVGALTVVEHLFNRIGERYLVLLNDTLPFLSESMEDESAEVEAKSKVIIKRIEQLTGDSIQEYLK